MSKGKRNNAVALYNLGCYYYNARRDYKKALLWFRLAAEKGITEAKYFSGLIYHEGMGVQKDLQKAIYWYKEGRHLFTKK